MPIRKAVLFVGGYTVLSARKFQMPPNRCRAEIQSNRNAAPSPPPLSVNEFGTWMMWKV